MVRRAIGGVERDYLLLDYRGGDKLYVPSDQIDLLLRPYTGGESPALSRLNGSDWQKAKSTGPGRGAGRSPRSWWSSTRSGSAPPGHAFGP